MDPLDRALRYPYDRPAVPVTVDPRGGRVRVILAEEAAHGRHPVLAIGSNAAPVQLMRKLAGRTAAAVAVVPARLHDRDVVFAARVARYGAVPATLVASPGTVAAVHLTLLTDAQLDVLHASERLGSAYELVDIPAHALDVPVVLPPRVPAYRARAGPLRLGGGPSALRAVAAAGRVFPARTQAAVLAWLAARRGWTTPQLVAAVGTGSATHEEINDWIAAVHTGAGPTNGP